MNIINFSFLSSDKTTNIHAIKWIQKSGQPTKILQITHGMVEYIERYTSFAEFLVMDNFLVVGHDHLGHGESIKTREDLGYFGEPNPSDLIVGDMHKLRTIIQNEYKELPYFMLGHSMGSYMLRKYISLYSNGLTGVIIMGTGYESSCTTSMGIKLIKFISFFRGWHYRSSIVANLVMGGGAYKKYDIRGKDKKNSWLTKDEQIVESYYNNPKCIFTFTLNGFLGLMEAVNYSCSEENIQKINKNLPIFIVSGNDDPVGNNGKGVKIVYGMMENAGIKDIQMKLYKNDRHEILNETDRETIFEDLKEWMNKYIMKNFSQIV